MPASNVAPQSTGLDDFLPVAEFVNRVLKDWTAEIILCFTFWNAPINEDTAATLNPATCLVIFSCMVKTRGSLTFARCTYRLAKSYFAEKIVARDSDNRGR